MWIPYCSGDIHVGTTENGYGGRKQVGYRNYGLDLERIVATFPDAERVVLSGYSAGGFGALFNFDRTQIAFGPKTNVILYDDSGPALAGDAVRPCLVRLWRQTWKIDPALPPDCGECSAPDANIDTMAVFLAKKYPQRRFGLVSSVEDATARITFGFGYSESCGEPAFMPAEDFREGLLAFRDETLAPYPNFRTFIPAGSDHTVMFGVPNAIRAGDVTLSSWLSELIGDGEFENAGP